MKSSEHLTVGEIYSRNDLQQRFKITDNTIKTGIFRPRGHDSIWLFFTRDKPKDMTPYQDSLVGDDLRWESQTAGRKDASLIAHEELGLEVLVFWRDSKQQYEDFGFRFEGCFRYVSHDGKSPARFHMKRIR